MLILIFVIPGNLFARYNRCRGYTNADCECDTDEICGCDCSDEPIIESCMDIAPSISKKFLSDNALVFIIIGIIGICIGLFCIISLIVYYINKRVQSTSIEMDDSL